MANHPNDAGIPLTDKQFAALERYENGRLVDLPNCFLVLTEAQVQRLHGDDWSYYQELQEEVAILVAEARAEFGM